MLEVRICLLMALVVATTSVTSAEDYTLPTGVTVLTEEQLLNQIIGNTLVGGYEHWVEYFEPPTGDQKNGRFKGKSVTAGPTSGDWTIDGSLMCWQYDEPDTKYNDCFTIVLDGDTVTFYQTTGSPWYNRHHYIKLRSGKPKNF